MDHLLSKETWKTIARAGVHITPGDPSPAVVPDREATSARPDRRPARRLPPRVRTTRELSQTIDRIPGCPRAGSMTRPATSPVSSSAPHRARGAAGPRVLPRPLAGGRDGDGVGHPCAIFHNSVVGHTRSESNLEVVVATRFIHERGPLRIRAGTKPSRVKDRYSGGRSVARRAESPPTDGTHGTSDRGVGRPFGVGAGPGRRGQVHKGTGGMPRRHQMTGVLAAISPGELPKERRSRSARRRRGELKHLSTRRKGNQPRLPQ